MKTGLFEDPFPGKPYIKEFVLKPLCDVERLQKALDQAGYFAALQTEEGYVTFCVTEKHELKEVEELIHIVESLK